MSSDSIWSFNLTTPLDDGYSSNEDEQCRETASVQKENQLLKDLDISSRVETVNYRPNPFSIAKINAAARSRNVPSAIPANPQSTFGASIQKPPAGRRQADIRELFRKQAQQSHTGSGVRLGQVDVSSRSRMKTNVNNFVPSAGNFGSTPTCHSLNDISTAGNSSTLINSGNPTALNVTDSNMPLPSTPIPEPVTASFHEEGVMGSHIADDFVWSQGYPKELNAFSNCRTLAQSDTHPERLDTPLVSHLQSPSVREVPRRLTLQPSFIGRATVYSGRKTRPSLIFGRLPDSRARKSLTPCKSSYRQLAPPPLMHTGNGSSSTPFTIGSSDTNHISVPALNIGTICATQCLPGSPPYPTGPIIEDVDLASDDTLVASPMRSPIASRSSLIESMPTRLTKPVYPSDLRDSDEEWTTLPQKKKAKTRYL
ncbi:hypothetical protein AX15_006590 [Amanita polypyramis BW_CC]|nr:hypothetical protein AX15_006590 [Amanita polypyramis BW_CC]